LETKTTDLFYITLIWSVIKNGGNQLEGSVHNIIL